MWSRDGRLTGIALAMMVLIGVLILPFVFICRVLDRMKKPAWDNRLTGLATQRPSQVTARGGGLESAGYSAWS
jgi:hypothetical protein